MNRPAFRTIVAALVSAAALIGAESVSFAQDGPPGGRGQGG